MYLEPGSKVPAELLPEVRAHRAEIVAALSRRQVPADAGLRSLLERLRRDQAWLTEHCDTHLAGLEAEGPYVASLMAWDVLERLLRRLYGYQGCVNESGSCPPAAPVCCTHCATSDRETA